MLNRHPVQLSVQQGFTLIEILVVLTILVFISGFALFVSMDSYRGYSFRSERDMAAIVLQKSRNQAISNICLGVSCTDGKPHGVHFASGQYTIFQGASFAARDTAVDQIIAMSSNAAIAGTTDIIFNQLDGSANAGTLTLSDSAGHSAQINVNSEGQIDTP